MPQPNRHFHKMDELEQFFRSGTSVAVIAEETGIPISTVYKFRTKFLKGSENLGSSENLADDGKRERCENSNIDDTHEKQRETLAFLRKIDQKKPEVLEYYASQMNGHDYTPQELKEIVTDQSILTNAPSSVVLEAFLSRKGVDKPSQDFSSSTAKFWTTKESDQTAWSLFVTLLKQTRNFSVAVAAFPDDRLEEIGPFLEVYAEGYLDRTEETTVYSPTPQPQPNSPQEDTYSGLGNVDLA